jgi:hypothetical protein
MKCPGQDSRYWGPEAIFEASCPSCGTPIEFFKDEGSRRCRKCGHKVLNPRMDFGCATYCKFAAQCLGDLPPEILAQRSDLLKDRVAAEVKKHLGRDFRRIGHVLKVVEHAGKISRSEGADPAVVTLAAYLSSVEEDSSRAEMHGAGTGNKSPEKKVSVAEDILVRMGAGEDLMAEVLKILETLRTLKTLKTLKTPEMLGRVTLSDGLGESANFRVVHDAVRIAGLEEAQKENPGSGEDIAETIEKTLLTESGRKTAGQVLMGIAHE